MTALPRTGVEDAAVTAALTAYGETQEDCFTRMARALAAAQQVYQAQEDAEVDRLMAETGFAGMDIIGRDVCLRIKHAAEVAKGMVAAFDEVIRQRGAENYVEWESTVTEPGQEHRQYKVIIIKPGGKSPHELRRDAESKLGRVTHQLRAMVEGLGEEHNDHKPTDGEPECPGCVSAALRRIIGEGN